MGRVRMLANKVGYSLVLFVFSNLVNAVGLSGIVIYSYLNEPLSAEIEILELEPSLAGEVTAELASPQDFLRVNIERQTFLNDLNFEVVNVNNKNYVYIFSYENLKNPYLELLIKLKWKDGSLLKSYTLLVDPLPKNLNSQTRAHAISESQAMEQRSSHEEKKISIPNLEKIKEQVLNPNDHQNENSNNAQIVLNDKVLIDGAKNADLTGMLTLSDASFDSLAEQTNKALQRYDSPSKVNFDAEDELERSQVKNGVMHPISSVQQSKILPITDILPIVASLKQNDEMALTSGVVESSTHVQSSDYNQSLNHVESLPHVDPSKESENKLEHNFPINLDDFMKSNISHEQGVNNHSIAQVGGQQEHTAVPQNTPHEHEAIHITSPSTEIPQFKDHPQHVQQTHNPEYKSYMVNFIVISALTLSLITMLIVIYRRYKNRSYSEAGYEFSAPQDKDHFTSDVLEEDDEGFDDLEDKGGSIDRKSIDAEIETYQKQLNEIDLDFQKVEPKSRVLPIVEPMNQMTVEESVSPQPQVQPENISPEPHVEELIVPVKKSVPTDAFDIAASRAGNSTGVDQSFVNNDKNDNEMIVEVDNISHYDLSAYKNDIDVDAEQEISKPQEPLTVVETEVPESLGFGDINDAEQEEVVYIEPPKENNEIIEETKSNIDEIKLADDSQPIQSLNRYDINVNHNDLDDLELNLDEHHIDSEGTAAFDNFDEANIKLDLAKQYYSAGYFDSAKEVINEIVDIGNTAQKELAQDLLSKIKEVDK